jgi:hypothetical protein
MKKTKKQCNPDLYINKEGILTGVGHIVIGESPVKKMKKVGKSVKRKIILPFCKTCNI